MVSCSAYLMSSIRLTWFNHFCLYCANSEVKSHRKWTKFKVVNGIMFYRRNFKLQSSVRYENIFYSHLKELVTARLFVYVIITNHIHFPPHRLLKQITDARIVTEPSPRTLEWRIFPCRLTDYPCSLVINYWHGKRETLVQTYLRWRNISLKPKSYTSYKSFGMLTVSSWSQVTEFVLCV
jgi:hypothetical protein